MIFFSFVGIFFPFFPLFFFSKAITFFSFCPSSLLRLSFCRWIAYFFFVWSRVLFWYAEVVVVAAGLVVVSLHRFLLSLCFGGVSPLSATVSFFALFSHFFPTSSIRVRL